MGQGEDDMEVVDRERVGAAGFEPVGLSERLTLRTVTVATRVADSAPVPAAMTRLEVTAGGCGAARCGGSPGISLNAHTLTWS